MFTVQYPFDILPILDAVKNSNWIVSNFRAQGDEIYNPASYLYNKRIENIHYEMRLDRNIYSYILSSSKVQKDNLNFRNAAALLCFCQMADIELNPTLAVYEGINYSPINIDKAIDELELFRQINNSVPETVYSYATGATDTYTKAEYAISDPERQVFRADLLRYERLTEWNSLYLLLLKSLQIAQDSTIKDKIGTFQKWSYEYFRISAVVTTFAAFLYSGNPPRGINKYRATDSTVQRKIAVYNMTWDIYIINQYLRDWVAKDEQTQIIFATADIAMQTYFRAAIELQNERNPQVLHKYLNPKDANQAISAMNNTYSGTERVYGTDNWSREYQQQLITDLESKLLS